MLILWAKFFKDCSGNKIKLLNSTRAYVEHIGAKKNHEMPLQIFQNHLICINQVTV